MVHYTSSDYVDTDLYEDRLRYNGYIAYDRDLMEDLLYFSKQQKDTLYRLTVDVMRSRSACEYFSLHKNSVFYYLTSWENCNESYFRKKGVQGISLDMKSVLSSLYKRGLAVEFLQSYFEYRSLDTKCNNVNGIVTKCTTKIGTNKQGRNLYRIPFSVNQQKNLRYNYKNFDVISQIPKEYCKCVSVEDGYFLAWGDFAQSDFRIAYNLFLRSPENDVIMNKYSDKYEALARILARENDEEFDLDKFKKERPLYKQLTLATIYGTRSSKVQEENIFITKLTKFLMTCPKYVEYLRRLNTRIDLGLPLTLTSYFGHEEICNVTYRSKEDIINDALNRPFQTGTSEIVILTINKILDTFYSLGYSEDEACLDYTRHDEPILKFKYCVLKDIWVLNQFKEILVDDWVPLELTFDFGYNYLTRDDELYSEVMQVFKENEHKIDKFVSKGVIDKDYFPIAPMLLLSCHYVILDSVTIVTFYDEFTHSAAYKLLNTTDEKSIHENIVILLAEQEEKIYDAGYRDVLIINNFFEFDNFSGTTFFKFKVEISARIDRAITLSNLMVCKYCKKNGLDSPVNPPLASDKEWIDKVSELEILQ